MADTVQTETVTPGDSQTTVQTGATPVVNAADPAEVERLRKEREQIEMERNQLRNELEARRKAEAEAEAKQLQEKEEYKTLFEKTQAQLEELKSSQEAQARQAELSQATESLFKEYPAQVVELAKTAGLSLTDDSDAAKASLKEKLDTFAKTVGGAAPAVTSSNPAPSSAAPVATGESWQVGHPKSLGEDTGNIPIPSPQVAEQKFKEYFSSHPGIQNTYKEMKRMAGVKTD